MSDQPFSIVGAWGRVLALQAVAFGINVAMVALIPLAVPPSVYGEYALMFSVVQVTANIVFSWLNQSLFRFGREEYAAATSLRRTLGTTLAAQAVLFVGFGFFVAVIALADPAAFALIGLENVHGAWLGAALFAAVAAEGASYATQAATRFVAYGTGQIFSVLGRFLSVAIIFVGLPGDPYWLLGGAAMGWLASAVIALRAVPQSARWPLAFDRDLLRRILSYGGRLPLGATAGILVTWMDIWFIRAMVGADAAGVYAWSYNMVALGTVVFTPLSSILAPRAVDFRTSNRPDAALKALDTVAALFLLVMALLPLALIFLRLGLSPLLPTHYAMALQPLVILCALLPIQLFTYLSGPFILAHENLVGGRVTAMNIGVAVVNAIGDWLLIPWLGGTGAAIAKDVALGSGSVVLLSLMLTFGAGTLPRKLWLSGAITAFGIGIAVAGAWLPATWTLALLPLSPIAILLLRRARGFEGLADMVPHFAFLPAAPRAILQRGLRLLDARS